MHVRVVNVVDLEPAWMGAYQCEASFSVISDLEPLRAYECEAGFWSVSTCISM